MLFTSWAPIPKCKWLTCMNQKTTKTTCVFLFQHVASIIRICMSKLVFHLWDIPCLQRMGTHTHNMNAEVPIAIKTRLVLTHFNSFNSLDLKWPGLPFLVIHHAWYFFGNKLKTNFTFNVSLFYEMISFCKHRLIQNV